MGELVKYDRAEQCLVDEAEICALLPGCSKSLHVFDAALGPTGKQLDTLCIILYHLSENLRGDGLVNNFCNRGW